MRLLGTKLAADYSRLTPSTSGQCELARLVMAGGVLCIPRRLFASH
jgi:hypothetical protein